MVLGVTCCTTELHPLPTFSYCPLRTFIINVNIKVSMLSKLKHAKYSMTPPLPTLPAEPSPLPLALGLHSVLLS